MLARSLPRFAFAGLLGIAMSSSAQPLAFRSLDEGARRAQFAGKSPEEQLALMDAVRAIEIVNAGLDSVKALSAYTAKLTKQERVKGEMITQTIDVLMQESPLAARLNFVAGAAKGRQVLYSAALRPTEIRVKEGGVLGFAGGFWIGMDSGLARKETNHPVTNLGLGPLLSLMKRDIDDGEKFGGLRRTEVRLDNRGRYCATYEAPKGATGLYATKTLTCVNLTNALPEVVEVHDARGFLERYEWQDIKRAKVDANTFTLEAAGL